MVTRRLFLQDDAAACKCDDCFVVWYKWTLEQSSEDGYRPLIHAGYLTHYGRIQIDRLLHVSPPMVNYGL